MKKRFKKSLILALIAFSPLASTAKEIIIDTLPTPQFMDSGGNYYTPDAASYPRITQAEQTIFRQSFAKEPIEMRLARIEKKMFNKSFDGYPLSQRTENILSSLQEQSVDRNSIASLEKMLFSKNFNSDTPTNRIQRLEQSVFGAVQAGELSTRLQSLKTASESYNSFPSQQTPFNNYNYNQNNGYGQNNGYSQKEALARGLLNAIPATTPKAGKIKSGIGSLASFFMGGNPTGWTPQVNMNDPMLSGPYNQTYSQYPQASRPYTPYTPYTPYAPQYQGYQQEQSPYYPQGQGYQQQYQSKPQWMDLFSSGQNGSEVYYDDGRFRKDLRNSSGGATVTILR